MSSQHLTVGEVARLFSVDDWRVRRVVDGLDSELPRAGLYRLIPRHLLPTIAIELSHRGWLPTAPEQEAGHAD